MNQPPDPNATADVPPDPADSLRASDPQSTDPVRGSADTDGSHPGLYAPPGELPEVPGYRVLREIARGGMGRVFAALELGLDRDVALKILLPGASADRFVRESKITARLPHPGIPPVHALGTLADGSPFLAMKLIAGQTLADELETADHPRLLRAFTQVCQAAGFAHSRGIIHRDLKPANVMVGAFGEVQVMDWGLAKDVASREAPDRPDSADAAPVSAVGTDTDQTTDHAPEEPADGHTRAGQVMGTPAYMAPEQARGEATDARTDVFALGGILCAILTGKPPFRGKSSLEVIRRAAAADLTETNARLDACGADAELVALCRHCLSPNPQNRPANGQVVADALTAHLNGVQERLRAAERARAVAAARAEEEAKTRRVAEEKAAEQQKRRKVQLALRAAVVGLVAVAGFGVALAALWQRAEGAKDTAVSAEGEAVTARQVAVKAQGEAEKAGAGEKVAREKLAVFEYGGLMRVAHQEWRDNNVAAARAHLQSTRSKPHGFEWHYVHRLCHSELLTLAHGDQVMVQTASFSRDGARIVTAGVDRTARVWEVPSAKPEGFAKTGTELRTLKGHTNAVMSASFSPDGSRVVTASLDRTARVWDTKAGTAITLAGHTDGLWTASFSSDGSRVVTASSDQTAKVWDAKTGIALRTLKGHTDTVSSASFNADGTRVATTSADGTVKVWDSKIGTELFTLKVPEGGVTSAAFNVDGSRILTVGLAARVWDAKTGTELLAIKGHKGVVTASFSPDGTRIVGGGLDGMAKVWDAKTGAEVLVLNGHTGIVMSASFSADGLWIVTASGDNSAKVWDATTGAAVVTLKGDEDIVTSASFSPDGSRVVTNCGNTAKVWDAHNDPEVLTLKELLGSVNTASFSPDGNRIVIGTAGDTVQVRDARTGAELLALKAHAQGALSASFSADGARVVTCGSDGAKVWDANTGTELRTLPAQKQGIWQVSAQTNGSRVVTSSGGKTTIWDVETGAELVTFKAHKNSDWVVSISADGSRVITSSLDNTAKVWNANTGTELFTLKGHKGWVQSASFSTDGLWIVTGSVDKTAKVWEVPSAKPEGFAKTGIELLTLEGHTGNVNAVSFGPDGSRVVTGSADKTAKIWDVKTGAEVLTLKGHKSGVHTASFSADGSRIVTGDWDRTVKVWDSRPFGDSRPPDRAPSKP